MLAGDYENEFGEDEESLVRPDLRGNNSGHGTEPSEESKYYIVVESDEGEIEDVFGPLSCQQALKLEKRLKKKLRGE
jgi:hypothetical protein